jgi:hypothetical protein
MNRFKNIIALFAFSLLVLALPTIASAQWRDRDRDDDNDDGYYRNDDYRNGRYNRNIGSTVKNLKNQSKRFEKTLDRELDNSRYDDRNREDNLNNLAERFKEAADDLEDNYDNGRNNRSQNEARIVLDLGSQLGRAISRSRLNYNVQNDWYSIEQNLRIIADAYGYNYNNRNNRRNNRNNRNGNGGWINRIPFPF